MVPSKWLLCPLWPAVGPLWWGVAPSKENPGYATDLKALKRKPWHSVIVLLEIFSQVIHWFWFKLIVAHPLTYEEINWRMWTVACLPWKYTCLIFQVTVTRSWPNWGNFNVAIMVSCSFRSCLHICLSWKVSGSTALLVYRLRLLLTLEIPICFLYFGNVIQTCGIL